MIKSRYKIKRDSDGLGITVLGRCPTKISVFGPTLQVGLAKYKRKKGYVFTNTLTNQNGSSTFHKVGLFNLYTAINNAVKLIMKDWEPPDTKLPANNRQLGVIKHWAITQCAKALSKRIRDEWRLMLHHANPTYVNVQRKVFSVCGSIPPQLLYENFYKTNPYIISDILSYRAAALSVPYIMTDSVSGAIAGWSDGYNKSYKDWMEFYGCDDSNVNLRKTLESIPTRIPSWLLPHFKTRTFPKVITDRVELIAFLAAKSNTDVVANATRKEIKDCVVKYHSLFQPDKVVNLRKSSYITDTIEVLTNVNYQANSLTDLLNRFNPNESSPILKNEDEDVDMDFPF